MPDVADILRAYSAGALSRGAAMERLGLSWYGDLLVLLNRHAIERPSLPNADNKAMADMIKTLFEAT
jgi:hypothetical protein